MGIDKYVYAAGDATYTAFISRVEKQSKGYNGVSLTNYDATAVCQIAEGSAFEVAGSVYLATADTSITGSVATGICYIYATGATATATVAWDTTNEPVWRDDHQGFYQSAASAVRALGGCYFDGSAYHAKWVYGRTGNMEHSNGADVLKFKVITIGDWDMDTDATNDVAHGLDDSIIYNVTATVRNDDDSERHTLNAYNVGRILWNATNIRLTRETGAVCDDAAFNATSYNRGWIFIWYGSV